MELKLPRKGNPMTDYCAFSKDHKCIKWTDYELLRHELEEADELCHNNWTEIQHLWEYIGQLQALLIKNKGLHSAPERHVLSFRKGVLRISEKDAYFDRNTQMMSDFVSASTEYMSLFSRRCFMYSSTHTWSWPQSS